MAKWKGSAKFTRQEMDAEITGLARQTIAVMTQEARQTVVDGHPNVEVEHVVRSGVETLLVETSGRRTYEPSADRRNQEIA